MHSVCQGILDYVMDNNTGFFFTVLCEYFLGASWEKFALGAKFINLVVGSSRQFYKMQLQYRVNIIYRYNKFSIDLEVNRIK